MRLVVAHDLMPHPRQVHNKAALRIPRHRVTNKAVARTLDYLGNRDALALFFAVASKGQEKILPRVRLRCDVTVWLTHNRLPDKDNLEKGVLDALVVAGIICDDRWIRAGETIIHDGAAKGMVAVEISLLEKP